MNLGITPPNYLLFIISFVINIRLNDSNDYLRNEEQSRGPGCE